MLVFSSKDGKQLDYGVPIYKHMDGYPENVLPLLKEYLSINQYRLKDIGYLSAGFLRFIEDSGNPAECKDPYTGYGLYEQPIGDVLTDGMEEYYYKITPTCVYVYDYYLRFMYKKSMEELFENY